MPKTFLVTGVAGFIGSHVANYLLERGDTVIGVDTLNNYYDPKLKQARLRWLTHDNWLTHRPNFHFYLQDIADSEGMREIFNRHRFDSICHLAAQAGVRYSLENPLAYIQSNVLGTTVVFELARAFKIPHLCYASSSSVYGDSPITPLREDLPTDRPISLYAATKKSNELAAFTYFHLFNIQSTGLRFFTVYGPWGRPDMAAAIFATSIVEGRPINVNNFGKMQRDFTYIDDIVAGVVAALDKPLGYEILNLGGNRTTELGEFIRLIEENLGREAKKNYRELQPGDVIITAADVSRAKELLGWIPQTSIEDGVKRYCQWFKEYYHV